MEFGVRFSLLGRVRKKYSDGLGTGGYGREKTIVPLYGNIV